MEVLDLHCSNLEPLHLRLRQPNVSLKLWNKKSSLRKRASWWIPTYSCFFLLLCFLLKYLYLRHRGVTLSSSRNLRWFLFWCLASLTAVQTIISSYVSMYNYPGGQALVDIHTLEHFTNRQSLDLIWDHLQTIHPQTCETDLESLTTYTSDGYQGSHWRSCSSDRSLAFHATRRSGWSGSELDLWQASRPFSTWKSWGLWCDHHRAWITFDNPATYHTRFWSTTASKTTKLD